MEKHPNSRKKQEQEPEKKIELAIEKLMTCLKGLIKKKHKTFRAFAATIDRCPTQLSQLLKSKKAQFQTFYICCRGLKMNPATVHHLAHYGQIDFTEESDVGWEVERR